MWGIEALLRTLEAVSIIVAACVAVWGVDAWRRELIGRRKAELAEQTLSAFYEARDIIRAARFPGGFGHEGRSRPSIEGETEDEASYRNAMYVPAERLLNNNEFFAKLEALKYSFCAVFGEASAEPFDQIKKVRNRILISSGMLIRTHSETRDSDRRPPSFEEWEQDIGWADPDDDALGRDILAAVARIEEICRPLFAETTPRTLLSEISSKFRSSQ